jgi:hypothetical protein
MLSEEGILEVKQVIIKNKKSERQKQNFLKIGYHAHHLLVKLSDEKDKNIYIYFDNNDSMEIDSENLRNSDIYFKRSYSANYIRNFHPEHKDDIYPLGLNYLVRPNRYNQLTLNRDVSLSGSLKRKIAAAVESFDTKNRFKFYPRIRVLHSLPKKYSEIKVLFMVTAYNPYDAQDRPKEKIEERIYNNEFRANCIRMLRKELGPRFYGGFIHNNYTTKMYHDVLLDKAENGIKKNYLNILDNFPICIATTGLHGSIGWKFAEYVSFAKAIISEKLKYEVPGNFTPGKNYLEFSTPEECVEKSITLLTNKKLRKEMMIRNAIYYQYYVRPDMLVFNAISTAMRKINKENAEQAAAKKDRNLLFS